MHQPVRREHDQVGVVAVAEEHHEVAVLGPRDGRCRGRIDLLGVPERGLVAVMPVGDEQRARLDVVDDGPHRLGRAHLGERVLDAVRGLERGHHLGGVQRAVEHARRIAVEHEAGREVGLRRAEELEPVFLRPRECALVGQHHAIGEGDHAHQCQEAAARAPCAAARRLEALIVAVERGLLVAHEHPVGAPAGQELGGVGVLRLALPFRENQPHHVVRRTGHQLLPLRRRR